MGTRLVAGRAFTKRDTEGTPQVAIVSETVARRYWPHSSPRCRAIARQGAARECTPHHERYHRADFWGGSPSDDPAVDLFGPGARAFGGGNFWRDVLHGRPKHAGDRNPHGPGGSRAEVLRLVLREGLGMRAGSLVSKACGRVLGSSAHRAPETTPKRRPRRRRRFGGPNIITRPLDRGGDVEGRTTPEVATAVIRSALIWFFPFGPS
jgi:hypothetical protein